MDKKYISLLLIILVLIILYRSYNKQYYSNAPGIIQIPLNIFLTWSTLNLPEKMQQNLDENKKNNPEFNFYLYDDKMCSDFIQEHFDESILRVFNNLKPGAYKADLFRYCILYINGGVYIDIKFKLHVKMIDLINKYGEIYVKDPDWYPDSCKRGCFNGFIVTKPKNPIFLDCINQIKENYNNRYYGNNILYPTGPCLLGFIIRSKYNDIIYNMKVTEHQNTTYTINDMEDNIILSQYPNYRDELSSFSTNKHYTIMWRERDIYK